MELATSSHNQAFQWLNSLCRRGVLLLTGRTYLNLLKYVSSILQGQGHKKIIDSRMVELDYVEKIRFSSIYLELLVYLVPDKTQCHCSNPDKRVCFKPFSSLKIGCSRDSRRVAFDKARHANISNKNCEPKMKSGSNQPESVSS